MPWRNSGKLMVSWVNDRQWRLLVDLSWITRDGRRFVAPVGFKTDFATVPWWARWLIPATGRWTKAAIIHDLFCDAHNAWHAAKKAVRAGRAHYKTTQAISVPRGLVFEPEVNARDTDVVAFRDILLEEKVNPILAYLMWTGVRWGALANPARRAGWLDWRDTPLVLAITAAVASPVALIIWRLLNG